MINPYVYYPGFWASFWAFTMGWSLRAGGRENVPKTGPVLLVSNHSSHFDPWIFGLTSPRPLTYLARSSLFKNKYLSALIRAYGAHPIDRDFGREGLESVLKLLEKNQIVIMFPEGTRSEDGKLQPFKPGVSLLIKRTNATIIPCGIAGSYEAWPKHQALPSMAPLYLPPNGKAMAVHFGEPVPAGFYKGMKREAMLDDLQQRIAVQHAKASALRRK